MRLAPRPGTRLVAATALVAVAVAVGVSADIATAGVRIVDDVDLREAAREGAIGLAVPGAGPTVTRESALATLLTGRVESSLVGGTPRGDPKLNLGSSEPPDVQVTLPPPGRTRNDRRYPITVVGRPGSVLTSDSTRIAGLVSLADVANGTLRSVEVGDPVATLARLDHRIERNASIRMPLTLVLVGAAIAAALVLPWWAPRLVLIALALNLWLAGWWVAVALALAAAALPLPGACGLVLGAYLVLLGLDPEVVALSPFGPSQAGRFYGLSNLLSTILLVPALLGAVRLRRAELLLVALAVTAVGGDRFGADGGGLLVLLSAYGVLTARVAGLRLTPARALGLAAGAAAFGAALVGLDAALGGSSHVSAALGDGPGAVLSDIGTRLEASLHRVTSGSGATVATLIGLGGLAFLLTRRRRGPATDALLAAIVVSLLVNDTPTDVASVGATMGFVVHRYERGWVAVRPAWLDRLRAMRRSSIAAATLVAAVVLLAAGCGGGEEVGATPETIEGTIPTETQPSTDDLPALALKGDATNGKAIFAAQGCGACHTLAAAGSNGNVGPVLDQAKPSYELVVQRVTLGQGGMPAFGDKLKPQEIADVAQFVASSVAG